MTGPGREGAAAASAPPPATTPRRMPVPVPTTPARAPPATRPSSLPVAITPVRRLPTVTSSRPATTAQPACAPPPSAMFALPPAPIRLSPLPGTGPQNRSAVVPSNTTKTAARLLAPNAAATADHEIMTRLKALDVSQTADVMLFVCTMDSRLEPAALTLTRKDAPPQVFALQLNLLALTPGQLVALNEYLDSMGPGKTPGPGV
ncbi:hypothetical protein AMAG_02513 [Allomyces macrogynus ATCC 38327]|uniref:Uncharacterized protein n=1 Tax=Allomyces macrogynus (strain ATCC 38327) TaxID=578462 RepID=A0A0L0S2G0_ALLM3|nr:hypothetical protein AMAG_02513 [Allomyces macrogynus ATCC 38327]|eukprot:KNE56733.1 hypothetical protein AMAG_02513 [Allomyces macrogynus ATCC 38327]